MTYCAQYVHESFCCTPETNVMYLHINKASMMTELLNRDYQ